MNRKRKVVNQKYKARWNLNNVILNYFSHIDVEENSESTRASIEKSAGCITDNDVSDPINYCRHHTTVNSP